MPSTRSSVLGAKLNAKDFDAARTLLRFHYDMKAMAASAPRTEHTMSLRVNKARTSMRPKRECAVYTPGMYAEED
jgi:hypothetical protein